jgi:Ca2+-dependent lipid-binding protein
MLVLPRLRCSTQVGRESFRSKTKKATLAASWDEQFYFGRKNKRNDVLAAHDVSVEVWDNDMFRDEKIGLCVVGLSGEN